MIARIVDPLLDASIVFSFDRTGYRRHARAHDPRDLDADLAGRVCLVTGANSGIGRAIATGLASRGAEVWLLCRNQARGRKALQGIREQTGNDDLHLEIVDLASLKSVTAFAERFPREKVDVLVHNAGVLPDERVETARGLELTLATNVVGPFLLTRLLEPKLQAARDARVIFVSSGGMYSTRLSLEDLDWTRRKFDGVAAYAQTKRMQVVLAEQLARRWRRKGITAHAMHPGWADTPAVRSSLPRFYRVMRHILRTPDEGADTALWLAVAPASKIGSGHFWFDRKPRSPHLLPWTRESGADRRRLWTLLHRLAGLPGRAGRKQARHRQD